MANQKISGLTVSTIAKAGDFLEVVRDDGAGNLSNVKAPLALLITSMEQTSVASASPNLTSVPTPMAYLTGTTAITSFGSGKVNATMLIKFAGVLTITHNASTLRLPGGVNVTTAANDIWFGVADNAGNWTLSPVAVAAAGSSTVKDMTNASNLASGTVADARLPTTQAGKIFTGTTEVTQFVEKPFNITSTNIDCSLGTLGYKTVAATWSPTFSNIAATGKVQYLTLELTNGGAYAITWPASIKWANGALPVLSSSGVDTIVMYTRDGGTTWIANMAGKGYA